MLIMGKQQDVTPLKFFWQIFLTILIALSAVEAPLFVVLKLPIDRIDFWKDLFISLIFFTDFSYSLSRKIRSKSKRPYLDIYLWIDLAASIPFDVISMMLSLSPAMSALRLVRLLRLLKLRKMFSFGNFTVIPWGLKIVLIVLFSLIAVNLVTCGWLYIYPNQANLSLTSFYLRGLYWTITTLTTIGYGDITPTNEIGMLYTIIVMILGVGVYGVVIGSFARLFALADRYKEQNREKFNDLRVFMKHYGVPSSVQKATFSYYDHLFSKRLSANDANIISELPVVLQDELKTYINIKMIRNIPAFQGSSHACLKKVATSLKQTAYAPGQQIIKKGDIGNEMYIIGHGEVDVRDGDKIIVTLNDGQYFGEAALIEEVVRNADVVAKDYTDLYTLNKDDFLGVIKCYPNLLENIKRYTTDS